MGDSGGVWPIKSLSAAFDRERFERRGGDGSGSNFLVGFRSRFVQVQTPLHFRQLKTPTSQLSSIVAGQRACMHNHCTEPADVFEQRQKL